MKQLKTPLKLRRLKLIAALCAAGLAVSTYALNWLPQAGAQVADPPRPLAPLSSVAVPEPPDLSTYVQNKTAAIALGKALFWDVQVGSDGMTSCASCHFHAGADNRAKNQLNPGCPDCAPGVDGYGFGGPNHQSQTSDYPFYKLTDPANRFSAVVHNRNEVTSSQGVFNTRFIDIVTGNAVDNTQHVSDFVFHVAGTNTRRVEPRNSPSVINAVFNFRNFWDGRAHHEFNGVNPFGDSDVNARVLKNATTLSAVRISMKNASLASQAVGPVLSDFEMSGAGRSFPKVGKKMLSLTPLAKQAVASDDSVLASYRNSSTGKGLNQSYKQLIEAAFRPEWWNNTTQRVALNASGQPVIGTSGEFNQMEYNFSLFFGLAVQLYEATLVSNQTPLDKFLAGDTTALTANQQLGKTIFEGKGKCIACHNGAETSNAVVSKIGLTPTEFMVMGDGNNATYDAGFYNIGVRPTAEDKGVGNVDPFGKPLSFSRASATGRVAVDGAFKTPMLRNIELTAPFFHNGGALTLDQVVEFYNRGGDFHEMNLANLDADIESLGLTAAERSALVDFMKAMTDERVRYHAAPFDHPELNITNGHPGNSTSVTSYVAGKAADSFFTLPAIGKRGGGKETTQNAQTVWVPQVVTYNFLAVPASATVNLSVGMPATQSSTYFAPDSTPNRAVDGNTDGNYLNGSVSHTHLAANSWWQVNLGNTRAIDYVQIFNRTDCCATRLANFYVFVADVDMTGRSYTSLLNDSTVKRYFFTGQASVSNQVPVNATGKYVRVQLAGTNYLALAEVQVWGK